ncbi:hypothetical protein KALB_3989 [Kutzneria albida DSM 43870]|uniref:Uncharacterized protein n=1 Tax=Kutzneria albida DSM 43870 TaxID=1449976 RepID=W5W889_9PSEU|nr:hypothetical protein KALB_3989 [Kutzneria albida DSM 43870]
MNRWWRLTRRDTGPEQVACRDEQGRRTQIEVHATGGGRVTLRLPTGELYELDPLEGVGRLRAVLRAKALESSATEGMAEHS